RRGQTPSYKSRVRGAAVVDRPRSTATARVREWANSEHQTVFDARRPDPELVVPLGPRRLCSSGGRRQEDDAAEPGRGRDPQGHVGPQAQSESLVPKTVIRVVALVEVVRSAQGRYPERHGGGPSGDPGSQCDPAERSLRRAWVRRRRRVLWGRCPRRGTRHWL